ncbi:hypothetical protein GEMRC1_011510 [Eukaryota sp. GEM-RC1]
MSFKMKSVEENDDGSSTMTIVADLFFSESVWLLSVHQGGLFFDGSILYIVNDVCAPEDPEFLEEIGFESVSKMKVNPDVHEKVDQLDYQGSKCDLYNVDPAKHLYVCLYNGFIAFACDGGLNLTENCQIFTDHEELPSSDARFTLEHHCSSIQKTAFSADYYVAEELISASHVDIMNPKMAMYLEDNHVLLTQDHTYQFDSEHCSIGDTNEELISNLQHMKIHFLTINTHETKEVLGQTCTIFRSNFSLLAVDLCIHDGFIIELCMPDECIQFTNHQEVSTDDPVFTPPEDCEIPEPPSFQKTSFKMTATEDDDDGSSTMTIIANFDSNVWMLDVEITEDDSSFRMAFVSDGSNFYIVNDVCAPEDPEILEEIGFESVNKMKVDPDVHEKVGQLDYQDSKCDLYSVDPAEDLYVCLYDGFIAIACDGGLDLTENCQIFSDHEELSSSDARFTLEHHCSSIQKTAFSANFYVDEDPISSSHVDILNPKMAMDTGSSSVIYLEDHTYVFDSEHCDIDDFDDEWLLDIQLMKITVFTTNTHETKEVLGQTCTIFRTDYLEDFTVDLCIHDGFLFEQCWEEYECVQFINHQEISADDPAFTPPEHCGIPEPVHQELYFAATLEREGETYTDVRFNLDSSLMWTQVGERQELVKDRAVIQYYPTICIIDSAFDLFSFVVYLRVPVVDFQFVDDDVIGGVSCKRYTYRNDDENDITNCISDDGFVLEYCLDNSASGEIECSYLTSHSVISANDPKFTVPDHCTIN